MYTKDVWTQQSFGNFETLFTNDVLQQRSNPWLFEFKGSKSGTGVSNYKQLIAEGANAASPFSCDLVKFVDVVPATGLTADAVDTFDASRSWHETFTGFAHSPGVIGHLSASSSKADAIALKKIYSKIKSELSTLSGASSLAELGDVIRQFGKPFDAIIDLTNKRLNRLELERRGLKGTTVFRKARWAQIVAATWLEYAFGLAPLISDTRKAAEALGRWKLENEVGTHLSDGLFHLRSRIVSRGEDEFASHEILRDSPPLTNFVFDIRTKVTTVARVQYCCGLQASIQAQVGSTDRLQQLLGFTPQDWLPAAWEVVPWSWLVDYFTNVGEILNAAATSTAGVTWITKTVSTVTEYKSVAVLDAAATKAGFNVGSWLGTSVTGTSGGSWKQVRTTVERTIPLTLGVPPLYIRLPDKWGQLANMAAVLLSKRPHSSALWLT